MTKVKDTKQQTSKKSKKRTRIRTVMLAPQIDNSRLFHWDKTGKSNYYHSDEYLVRLSSYFEPKNSRYAKKGTSLYEIYRYYQHYYFGSCKPRHTFKGSDYIFDDKRKWSDKAKCKAIGCHLILRLLVFHAMDSVRKQSQQQRKLPKNKRHVKVPDTPHIAFILHDKDKDLKPDQSVQLVSPHCQTSIHFSEPIKIKQVASWLGVAQNDIQKGKQDNHSEENAMAYLTHIKQPWDTANYLPKHHYKYTDVISDIPWFKYRDLRKRCLSNWKAYRGKLIKAHYNMSLSELNQKLIRGDITMTDILGNDTLFTVYCSKFKNDTDKIAKAVKDRKSNYRNAKFNEDWKNHRFHRTYALCCGESRAGKSYIAEHAVALAGERLHMATVKLNGKKGTLFQNYKGQDLVVLDEVRKDSMPFDTFIQCADQTSLRKLFGQSKWTARGAVMTEPFRPAKFLSSICGRKHEDMTQALGRLDLVIQAVKVKDKSGREVLVHGKPKRMAEIYHIYQKPTKYFYRTGNGHGFKSNMVLYPNPHLNYYLGKFAMVTPKKAIQILADKICKDNNPKLNHESNDRPGISDDKYTKPTPQEMKRIKQGVAHHDKEAVAVKNRLDKFHRQESSTVQKGIEQIKNHRSKPKISVNDDDLPF